MSRFYEMTVTLRGVRPGRLEVVKAAALEEWDFDGAWFELVDDDMNPAGVQSSGRGSLCGGESEDEFALRLAKAIWKANGEFCQVEVTAIYLEELPFERYCFSEDDFDRIMSEQQSEPEGENDE